MALDTLLNHVFLERGVVVCHSLETVIFSIDLIQPILEL